MGKQILFNWVKSLDGVYDVVLEGWLPDTKQRPDIMFMYNNQQYVIEFQCTPISSELLERRELYKAAGVVDIWVMGLDKYTVLTDEKTGNITNNYSKTIEREVFAYLDVKNNNLLVRGLQLKEPLFSSNRGMSIYYVYKTDCLKFDWLKNKFELTDEYVQDLFEEINFKNRIFYNRLSEIINEINSELNTDFIYYKTDSCSAVVYSKSLSMRYSIYPTCLERCMYGWSGERGFKNKLYWSKEHKYRKIITYDIIDLEIIKSSILRDITVTLKKRYQNFINKQIGGE